MSKIIDLSVVTQQPITLKISESLSFTIPPEPSVESVYKIIDFEDKINEAKTNKEQFDLLVDMVTMILKQDTSQKVDRQTVKKHLSFSQMQAVVKIYQEQIIENKNNPN